MKEKIKELHASVVGSGLQGTANEMQVAFQVPVRETRRQGKNSNDNSNCANDKSKGKVQTTKVLCSEETIYKKAVEKKNRDSSSSGDFGIDTSDELLQTELNDLNISVGPIMEADSDEADHRVRQMEAVQA